MIREGEKFRIYNGDCLEVLKTLPDASIDCVISSPPYYQLRDYGFESQWGLEKTFAEYLCKLWALMDEVKRVLKPTGTAWINLGDTYSASGKGDNRKPNEFQTARFGNQNGNQGGSRKIESITPSKSLLLIPHRFAIGCIDRGWILRNDIVWAKRNGMPESVTDRFSKKHEYFFLMAKQAKYYFDLDAVRDANKYDGRKQTKYQGGDKDQSITPHERWNPLGKNPGSVADFWDIPTRPSSAKHYATFNTELIDKPIKAGCPVGGIILDMFCGTATTGVRALQLDRRFIGIDGKKEYCEIAEERLQTALEKEPLFQTA